MCLFPKIVRYLKVPLKEVSHKYIKKKLYNDVVLIKRSPKIFLRFQLKFGIIFHEYCIIYSLRIVDEITLKRL
jgi:hypothetical protein